MNEDAQKLMDWIWSLCDMFIEDKVSKEVFVEGVESVMNIAKIIGVEEEVMRLRKENRYGNKN